MCVQVESSHNIFDGLENCWSSSYWLPAGIADRPTVRVSVPSECKSLVQCSPSCRIRECLDNDFLAMQDTEVVRSRFLYTA